MFIFLFSLQLHSQNSKKLFAFFILNFSPLFSGTHSNSSTRQVHKNFSTELSTQKKEILFSFVSRKLKYSQTHTKAERKKLFTSFSLFSRCSNKRKVRNNEAWFSFCFKTCEISSGVFLFYRLKNWFVRNVTELCTWTNVFSLFNNLIFFKMQLQCSTSTV